MMLPLGNGFDRDVLFFEGILGQLSGAHDSFDHALPEIEQAHTCYVSREHVDNIQDLKVSQFVTHFKVNSEAAIARVIIWSASREMEESTGLQSQALLMNVSQGLSIKKSLHNFLQKRKKRSQSHSSIVAHNVKN
ncbi:hypothetical protein VNO77_29541 [Canavalia gladiata]|uniref:Uncharacterized protein n=1 Tax=Canavalia gladiata TaxID=3824 RepID=A0AAN9KNL8_CANGL